MKHMNIVPLHFLIISTQIDSYPSKNTHLSNTAFLWHQAAQQCFVYIKLQTISTNYNSCFIKSLDMHTWTWIIETNGCKRKAKIYQPILSQVTRRVQSESSCSGLKIQCVSNQNYVLFLSRRKHHGSWYTNDTILYIVLPYE